MIHFCEQYINSKPRLGRPAILIFPEFDEKHGNHGSADFLTLRLKSFMKQHHLEPFVFQISYKNGTWDEQLPHIKLQCLQIQKTTEQNQIYFIAHSLGGILAMIFSVFEAPSCNIDIPQIITIATPSEDCKLFDIRSSNLLPNFPKPPNLISIGSPENVWVPHMFSAIQVSDNRHSILLVSEKICQVIEEKLEKSLKV